MTRRTVNDYLIEMNPITAGQYALINLVIPDGWAVDYDAMVGAMWAYAPAPRTDSIAWSAPADAEGLTGESGRWLITTYADDPSSGDFADQFTGKSTQDALQFVRDFVRGGPFDQSAALLHGADLSDL